MAEKGGWSYTQRGLIRGILRYVWKTRGGDIFVGLAVGRTGPMFFSETLPRVICERKCFSKAASLPLSRALIPFDGQA